MAPLVGRQCVCVCRGGGTFSSNLIEKVKKLLIENNSIVVH
jgi:hypothetical protein